VWVKKKMRRILDFSFKKGSYMSGFENLLMANMKGIMKVGASS